VLPVHTTLVLLPGLDGSRFLFAPLCSALGPQVQTVVIEYPPHGPNSYDDLLPLVRQRLPQEPFVMMASSFSGPLALRLAAERPTGLRGVILCTSFATSPHPWFRWLRFAVRPMLARLYPAASRIQAKLLGYATPTFHAVVHPAARFSTPAALAQRVRAALTANALSALAACPVPILCLAATQDIVVPARAVRVIQAAVPSAQVERIHGPHIVLALDPGTIARHVVAFLTRVSEEPQDGDSA
jgi:pimeloyl-ACP methyl ester carboxylesterase